ncbi:MAG: fatty acid desaturase [Boseongicola sp.]|nr:fatty acid desaturase [Boseongicola sp.]MDD9977265.1 fatty acid desaturase [Boseongicola sp.]
MQNNQRPTIEWPTVFVTFAMYAAWMLAVFWVAGFSTVAAIALVSLTVALHASLTHETIHGHPFKNPALNAATVYPALGIMFPYGRFRDTHLAHHLEEELTDPYDDPESNYLASGDWSRIPAPLKALLRFNNTLLGRLTVGPAIGVVFFVAYDARRFRSEPKILMDWVRHIPAAGVVLALVWLSPMPIWAYLVAAYIGHSIIRIRTYLEHQAHENRRGRTAIVEGGGLLSFLFLNNNLHVVHHAHPQIAWYDLPKAFEQKRDHFLKQNEGYHFGSYGQIFRRFLIHAKDPVPHPHRRLK